MYIVNGYVYIHIYILANHTHITYIKRHLSAISRRKLHRRHRPKRFLMAGHSGCLPTPPPVTLQRPQPATRNPQSLILSPAFWILNAQMLCYQSPRPIELFSRSTLEKIIHEENKMFTKMFTCVTLYAFAFCKQLPFIIIYLFNKNIETVD